MLTIPPEAQKLLDANCAVGARAESHTGRKPERNVLVDGRVSNL